MYYYVLCIGGEERDRRRIGGVVFGRWKASRTGRCRDELPRTSDRERHSGQRLWDGWGQRGDARNCGHQRRRCTWCRRHSDTRQVHTTAWRHWRCHQAVSPATGWHRCHADEYRVAQKKNGATISLQIFWNSVTELRGNWWTSAILYHAEHSH